MALGHRRSKRADGDAAMGMEAELRGLSALGRARFLNSGAMKPSRPAAVCCTTRAD